MTKVILILGMHRSGTSALTRVMSLMGAALPKSILGKNSSNLRGHWESEVMIAAHEKLLAQQGSSWTDWRRLNLGKTGARVYRGARELFTETFESEFSKKDEICVVKEPRICRFAAPYIEAMEGAGAELHSLIMVRNPLEVAASLSKRDELAKLDGLYLWLTYMLEAELATRKGSRQFVAYDEFLSSPIQLVKSINKELPFSLPYKVSDVKKQIESYVSPNLKRQNLAAEDIVLDPLARGWVSDAYEAFLVLCENPKSTTALEKLDDIRKSYFAVIEPLHDLLVFERARLNEDFKESLGRHLGGHMSAVDKLQADHEAAWKSRDDKTAQTWKLREQEHERALEAQLKEYEKVLRARDEEKAQSWKSRDDETAQAWQLREQEHERALEAQLKEHEKVLRARDEENAQSWKSRDEETAKSWQLREQEHEKALAARALEHEKALAARVDEHKKSLKACEQEHETAWAARDQEHAKALGLRDLEHSKALEIREQEHAKAWELREKEFEKARRDLQKDHESALESQEKRFAETLENLQTDHRKAEAEWDHSFARQETEHQATVSKMNLELNFMRDEFGKILRSEESRVDKNAADLEAMRAEMSAVLNSTSWKMTSGLRRIMNLLKGVKTQAPASRLGGPDAPPRLEYKPKD